MRRRSLLAAAALVAASALPRRAGAQGQKVSIGVLRLASSGPLFIAIDKGYFRAEGLEVEPKFFTAAQQIPVAATAGDCDFGVTGLTAGFYNLAGKGALKMIAGQSREERGFELNAYIVTQKAWDGGFRSPKDFQGKRVAWSGEVAEVSNGTFGGLQVSIKMEKATLVSDISLGLKKEYEDAASKLTKGAKIKFVGTLKSYGGAILPAMLSDGELK